MRELIIRWKKSGKKYDDGVSIYVKYGDNDSLKKLLQKEQTEYCKNRLSEELDLLLNPQQFSGDSNIVTEPISDPVPKNKGENSPVYDSCIQEANKAYKESMNARAVLFSMIPDGAHDINAPQLVDQRRDLALKTLRYHAMASELYDKADFVKTNGYLPDSGSNQQTKIQDVHDVMVFYELYNRRKRISRVNQRDKTPENVQESELLRTEIDELEKRWQSLKLKFES